MKSTIEAVRAIGQAIAVLIDEEYEEPFEVYTTFSKDKIYFVDTSITVSKFVVDLVDAYNYLLFGKARRK